MLLGWIVTSLIVIGMTSWLTPKGQKLRKRWTDYKPSMVYPKQQDAEAELPLIAMLASDKLHDWCRLYTWLGASPQWLEGWSDSTDDLYKVLITTWDAFKDVPKPRTSTTSGSASAGSGG
jgi:hypothetical protein